VIDAETVAALPHSAKATPKQGSRCSTNCATACARTERGLDRGRSGAQGRCGPYHNARMMESVKAHCRAAARTVQQLRVVPLIVWLIGAGAVVGVAGWLVDFSCDGALGCLEALLARPGGPWFVAFLLVAFIALVLFIAAAVAKIDQDEHVTALHEAQIAALRPLQTRLDSIEEMVKGMAKVVHLDTRVHAFKEACHQRRFDFNHITARLISAPPGYVMAPADAASFRAQLEGWREHADATAREWLREVGMDGHNVPARLPAPELAARPAVDGEEHLPADVGLVLREMHARRESLEGLLNQIGRELERWASDARANVIARGLLGWRQLS
jgi:hypothetical protein